MYIKKLIQFLELLEKVLPLLTSIILLLKNSLSEMEQCQRIAVLAVIVIVSIIILLKGF